MNSKYSVQFLKAVFFGIYKERLIRDAMSLGIAADVVIAFYNLVLQKSYIHFSPAKYLKLNQFTYDKIFFTLAAAHVFAKKRGLSIIDVADKYTHELKFQIRNEADGVSDATLPKIWAKDSVAIFNIFNAIKFSSNIFDATPFLGKNVLDVGCSVGGASWLAWRRGANAFTLSDMAGAALDTAGDTIREYCGGNVSLVPIVNSSDVPDFGKNRFDVAMCLHTFEHTQDPVRLALAILDSLKPNGHFLYTYYYAPIANGINTVKGRDHRSEALNLIKSKLVDVDGFDLNPYSIGKKKKIFTQIA